MMFILYEVIEAEATVASGKIKFKHNKNGAFRICSKIFSTMYYLLCIILLYII